MIKHIFGNGNVGNIVYKRVSVCFIYSHSNVNRFRSFCSRDEFRKTARFARIVRRLYINKKVFLHMDSIRAQF